MFSGGAKKAALEDVLKLAKMAMAKKFQSPDAVSVEIEAEGAEPEEMAMTEEPEGLGLADIEKLKALLG